jgi:hypothetical protein
LDALADGRSFEGFRVTGESTANIDEFTVNFDDISTAQTNDLDIQNWINLPSFKLKNYHGKQLVSRQGADGQWQIIIPEALVANTITWYHHIMGHVSSSREYDSIWSIFWFLRMRRHIDAYVHTCDTCFNNTRTQVMAKAYCRHKRTLQSHSKKSQPT